MKCTLLGVIIKQNSLSKAPLQIINSLNFKRFEISDSLETDPYVVVLVFLLRFEFHNGNTDVT